MPQSKDIERQVRLKNKIKTQPCVTHKKHISTDKNKHWLRVKRQKKIFQAKRSPKQAGIATVIFHKVDSD
jgi:hypothetical protein